LHTFENEYSYKINLDNLNSNAKGTAVQSNSGPKKSLGMNKKNHLFKEVIVEDEAEQDMRGSQMVGGDVNGMNNLHSYGGGAGATIGKVKGPHGGDNMISMNRDSNSPTPQRNGNKILVSGGIKLPV